jgi:hypothetical protein
MGIVFFMLIFFESRVQCTHVSRKKVFNCKKKQVHAISCFKTSYHTSVAVLEHRKGAKFIVKQETRNPLYLHLSVVRDKLGAFVAESVGVEANHIRILPAGCVFAGKRSDELPASLHTFVPGVPVHELPKELKALKVFIQQPVKASIHKKEWGLTRRVIHDMSLHPDLPKIVALDTFIANIDRHKGNFFYDISSDHFFLIDLESSFNKNVGAYACRCIASMMCNKDEQVSVQELGALESYRDMLKLLLELHSPESLYRIMVEYAFEAGILSHSPKKRVVKELSLYEQSMKKNYDSCIALVLLLDQLIAQYKHV